MEVVRKTDLVKMAAKKARNALVKKAKTTPQDKAQAVVDAFLYSINHSLLDGKKVEIRFWAVLTPKLRTGRKGRHIKTGEILTIPPTWRIKFKASKVVERLLNQRRQK